MASMITPDTDEHKEQAQEEQSEFKMRIAAERKAEAEALEKREAEEALMRAMKSKTSFDGSFLKEMIESEEAVEKVKKVKKKAKKPKKTRAKKTKKISLKIEPVVVKPRKLPVYHHQVEVDEFNMFKVDYIRKQIHSVKDANRKAIYENALNKYDLTNYWKLKHL